MRDTSRCGSVWLWSVSWAQPNRITNEWMICAVGVVGLERMVNLLVAVVVTTVQDHRVCRSALFMVVLVNI